MLGAESAPHPGTGAETEIWFGEIDKQQNDGYDLATGIEVDVEGRAMIKGVRGKLGDGVHGVGAFQLLGMVGSVGISKGVAESNKFHGT